MLKAIEKFDSVHDSGACFITYASKAIQMQTYRFAMNNLSTIRVPERNRKDLQYKYQYISMDGLEIH